MSGDLHCHTKLSDGTLGLEELIALAAKRGVETIAITDHDCLAGTVRAKIIGERNGVKVIPGVELSETLITTTAADANIWGSILIFIVPGAVLGGGIIYWVRRRRR